jgi:hypothetical protein
MRVEAQDGEGVELRLPFAGFYQTVHDVALDAAAEAAGVDPDAVDWPVVRLGYAQAYMREVSRLTGVGMVFGRISSPEFYNFGTDEILVWVSRKEIAGVHAGIVADPEQEGALRTRVREELSPRAGFAPYHPADLDDWGPLDAWGPARMSLLLDHAFARAGADEALIADAIAERALDLVLSSPRAGADVTPDMSEDPAP